MKSASDIKIKGKYCKEWTLSELRAALKRRKEKVSGNKKELCERLKLSLKSKVKSNKISSKKQISSIKTKIINVNDPFFRYYSSLYYQVPGSSLAANELAKYGLSMDILKKFKTYKNLISYYKF